MRVFVYEYFTAHGIGRDPGSPDHGIYREGRAMRDALAADFAHVPGVDVVLLDQHREEDGDFDHELWRVAEECDHTVVIAPETDLLLERFWWAVAASASQWLGPSLNSIRLTSEKFVLADYWREHHVPTPATTDREPTPCEAFPVVWKPRDGAGSTATFRLNSPLELARAKAQLAAEKHNGPMILQEFVPGWAASGAFLCGAAGHVPLMPTFQLLSDDGRFKYRGGELPIPPALAERAVRLAQRAVDCVPGLLGYVGVDLVLGDAADGSRDFAIEINPRLTTSYVGLRALADFNIAGAMLRVAKGETVEPRWKPGRLRFAPDGTVSAI